MHLQRLNESFEPRAIEYPNVVGSASFQFGGADQVLTLTGADSDAPVIVERIRVMGPGQIVTRHDTVVRQGNRVLSIFRGNQAMETGAVSNVVAEEDLELYW
jgi:hypothetical protein